MSHDVTVYSWCILLFYGFTVFTYYDIIHQNHIISCVSVFGSYYKYYGKMKRRVESPHCDRETRRKGHTPPCW